MNPKYLKLGIIFAIPVFIALMWRGFMSIFTTSSKPFEQEPNIVLTGDTAIQTLQNTGPISQHTGPIDLYIGVPIWFATGDFEQLTQQLSTNQITIHRTIMTGYNYHDEIRGLIKDKKIDIALISTDNGADCDKTCGLVFTYSQPIEAFIINQVSSTIYNPNRTMIPYGLDPLVTFHTNKHKVSGSWSTLFNNTLINTSDNDTIGSLPLAIGIGAADKALLRAGKESYPGYAELLHQMIIQFSNNDGLLRQFIQLTDTAKLRSITKMRSSIETIANKFPICEYLTNICLVRFGISHYGFGYLTQLMYAPQDRTTVVQFDQFPIETTLYPVRLRGFIINQQSMDKMTALSQFMSAYITQSINTQDSNTNSGLISPFTNQIESQFYDTQYTNIVRYTDIFTIQKGGKATSLDRSRNGGLMGVLEGNSSIQLYLSQQGVN